MTISAIVMTRTIEHATALQKERPDAVVWIHEKYGAVVVKCARHSQNVHKMVERHGGVGYWADGTPVMSEALEG